MWAALINVGLNLFEGAKEDEMSYEQAQTQIKSIDEQLGLINKQKDEYQSAFSGQKDNIYDMAGNRLESLGKKIGLGFKENFFKTESEASKSGLAFSGTVKQRSDFGRDTLSESFRSGKQNIVDDREQSISKLNLEKTKLLNSLELRQADLEAQKAMYEQVEEVDWFDRVVDPLGLGWFDGMSKGEIAADFATMGVVKGLYQVNGKGGDLFDKNSIGGANL